MINWNLCFICQRSTNKVLRSSNDGLSTLATNIPKFNELERLKFNFSPIANENENLLSILHNTCQSSYSESKLKILQSSNEKQQKLLRRKARMKFLKNEVLVQQKSQGVLMYTNSNVVSALSTMMKPTSELLDNNGLKLKQSLSLSM